MGLTQHSTSAHVCRALLDAVSFQTVDVLDAMRADADDAGAFGGGPATDAATDGRTVTETNEPKTIFSRAVRLYLRLDLAKDGE